MAPVTTVLVVDYDDGMYFLIRAIFEPEFYRVVQARSAFEAMERVREETPNLVVIPTNFLVKQGGRTLAEQMWTSRGSLPVIFIAEWNELEDGAAFVGPCRVVTRPIRAQHLVEAAADLLRTSE